MLIWEIPFNKEELYVRLQKLIEIRRHLQRHYAGSASIRGELLPQTRIEDAFLQKVRAIIEARLSDSDFNIVQLAQSVHMSRVQLYRKLKALTNLSPSLFVRSIRLEPAKRLLRS